MQLKKSHLISFIVVSLLWSLFSLGFFVSRIGGSTGFFPPLIAMLPLLVPLVLVLLSMRNNRTTLHFITLIFILLFIINFLILAISALSYEPYYCEKLKVDCVDECEPSQREDYHLSDTCCDRKQKYCHTLGVP